jgi:5-methylcytosine-specific restriction endonuclease McrA
MTGRRCDCKFGLQREHVIPLGKGGSSELSNMQLLCATHNQLRARLAFGDEHVDEKINATSSREGNRRSFRGP